MLVNARDAMQGTGSIRVATRLLTLGGHELLADGAYVELTVEDDGPGIPPAIASQVFEPFFTTKKEGQGTGLGLSQVYAFAAQAGGSATIQCGMTSGTTVTLLLKVRDSAIEERAHTAPPESAPQIVSAVSVLLVDDDDRLRDVMARLLADAGYEVEAVCSGFSAIEAIRHRAPDIVVSDCAMRDFSGVALARVLRDIRPGLPILLLTGHADLDAVRASCEHGAVVLHKPVSLEHLIAGIESLLAPVLV
jgi:CheY-like chemotaxis protein